VIKKFMLLHLFGPLKKNLILADKFVPGASYSAPGGINQRGCHLICAEE
jgi:hypothetical protein